MPSNSPRNIHANSLHLQNIGFVREPKYEAKQECPKSVFGTMGTAPQLESFLKNQICAELQTQKKANLTIGAYRDGEGMPWVLPVVREAKRQLCERNGHDEDHEPLGPFGCETFINAAIELLFGKKSKAIEKGEVFGIHCVSGTGSLRVGAEFLCTAMGMDTVFISDPTWREHKFIFRNAGFANIKNYRYYDRENRCLDFEGMCADLQNAKEKSVVVLQPCAHNPTGIDLSKDQWLTIAHIIKRRKLLPFFDVAYQGLASGNLDDDAWPIRHFVEQRIELLTAQSFSKNFGLYNERVGALLVVAHNPTAIPAIRSQLCRIVRGIWSFPPAFGAKIVQIVLMDLKIRHNWAQALQEMTERMKNMRIMLREHLEELGVPGNWAHITQQRGMFCYTGLTSEQVKSLERLFNIFMLSDGRINVSGLNPSNIAYVANAFQYVIKHL